MQLRRRPPAPKLQLGPRAAKGGGIDGHGDMAAAALSHARTISHYGPWVVVYAHCSTVQRIGAVAGGGGGEGGRRRGEGSRARKTQAEDMIKWTNRTVVLPAIACAVTYRAVL
jgi:hypothetical protein